MATTLQIGAYDQTTYIRWGSMTCKLNSLDLVLVDPAHRPAINDLVTLTNPSWSGYVKAVKTADPVDRPAGHVLVTVACINTTSATGSAGPFNLSDNPSPPTSYGYRGLSVNTQANQDGSQTVNGSCLINQAGLWPAMAFNLTSGNQGISAVQYAVSLVTVTWPTPAVPSFQVDFGDPIQTMAQWTAAQAASAPAGSIPGTAISPGTLPPTATDTTAPSAPTGLGLSSEVGQSADGTSVVRLIATLTQPTATDLFGSYVQVTALADDAGNPVWTNPAVIFVGVGYTAGSIPGVAGATKYWGRAYAVDTFDNRSSLTAVVSTTTLQDSDAPPIPVNFTAVGGFRAIALAWDSVGVPDLAFYDARYAVDDGSGTGPTNNWQHLYVATTTVFVANLTPGQKYWAQIRAVDFSGNVRTSAGDSTAVQYDANPEAGWSGLLPATASAIGSADIAVGSILASHISTAGLDASVIKAGLLKIGASSGLATGLEVWYSGQRIGRWIESGLYIGTNAAGLPDDLSASSYVRITDAGLTLYQAGVAQAAISPAGINASAVLFGALPGGHNLVLNSGFELAAFLAAPSVYDWDTSTQWNATRVGSDTNVTTNAGDLTVTALTY